MNLNSREAFVLAILFATSGLVMVLYGIVQGYLLIGISGLLLLFFTSYKINSINMVTLYCIQSPNEENNIKRIPVKNLILGNKMGLLKSDFFDKQHQKNIEYMLFQLSAWNCLTSYNDNSLVSTNEFVSRAFNSSKAIVSRYAYESYIKSGKYTGERYPRKIMAATSTLDFKSFADIKSAKNLFKKIPKLEALNLILFLESEKSEINSILCSFSKKSAAALLMYESNRLIINDIYN
jgi:hypothetical protein